MFLASFGTFLFSKEYMVIEHEFWTGLVAFFVFGQIIRKVSPAVSEMVDKSLDEEAATLKGARLQEIQK